MVPYAATLHGRLATGLEGRVRVYSFGASGAPLSQYLVWAHQAVRDLGAKALVINVIGNDFDESLAAYSNRLGFWLYITDADGDLRLRLCSNIAPDRCVSLGDERARTLLHSQSKSAGALE